MMTGIDTPPDKVKVTLDRLGKLAVTCITIATEICIVLAIGAYVGNYLGSKIIVSDCQRVAMAKVGDTYLNCSIVIPKKDTEAMPPR